MRAAGQRSAAGGVHPIRGDRLPHAGAKRPEAFDITQGDRRRRASATAIRDFGRGCLIARRLAERGVRMVQVYFGNFQPWDNHDDIQIHRTLAAQADPPIAALLHDLKASGMLKDTLVIIGGEFGRTPAVEVSGLIKVQNGRDHNSHGFSYVLAGGGVKSGIVYGATDEFGFKAVEKPVHVHDLHATVLHLMGLRSHAPDLSIQRPGFSSDRCRRKCRDGHRRVRGVHPHQGSPSARFAFRYS